MSADSRELEQEMRRKLEQEIRDAVEQEMRDKLEKEIREKLEKELREEAVNKKMRLETETVISSTIEPGVGETNRQETDEPHGSSQMAIGTRIHYKKVVGFANMSGEWYEVKLAALLFARLLKTAGTFHIASNMKAGNSFDDIVLRLNHRTVFIQLKHREKIEKKILKTQLLQDKGDFSLVKYCNSFRDVKQQWASDADLQQCGSFESASFVLYTNAVLMEGITNQIDGVHWKEILNTGGKCLSFTEEKCPLCSVDLSVYKEFLSQLWFFTEQASESQLDVLIKSELRTVCGSDAVFTDFLEGVQSWWKHSNTYLTEETKFWTDIVKSCIDDLNQSKFRRYAECLKFHKSHLIHLPAIHRAIHIVSSNTTLTIIKVHQSLSPQLHLLVDSNALNAHKDRILALWGKWCDLLVVEEDELAPSGFLHGYTGRRFVRVCQLEPEGNCAILHDEPDIMQLDEATQTRVLSAVVQFQGHDVPLAELVNNNKHCVPADAILQLLTQKLVLANDLPGDLDHYIARSLKLTCKVLDNILFHTSLDSPIVLAVSGLSQNELEQFLEQGRNSRTLPVQLQAENRCKVVQIDTEEDFLKQTELYETVHWLHRQGDVIMWKQSKGDMTVIQNYLCDETCQFKRVNSIKDIPYRLVLLSAEPGMGKSTLLTHLALGTKLAHPATWVIRAYLSDFTQQLSRLPANVQLQDTFEFLLEVSGIEADWKNMFRIKLRNMHNVCILFDGFDEISPTYTDKVTRMLQCLKSTQVQHLWVTTRPIMRQKLEQELSTIAFTMQPFSGSDQKNFLCRFWGSKLGRIDKSCLNTFVHQLLKLARSNLNDREREFTGIPLQTLLLAEEFEDNLRAFNTTKEMRLPSKFDLLQLYNNFVERKLEIYHSKNKIDMTKPGILHDYSEVREMFMKNHMLSALTILLPGNEQIFKQTGGTFLQRALQLTFFRGFFGARPEVQDLSSMERFIKPFLMKIEEGKDQTGIIKQVVNSKPVFIHRTFAEYFAALWLTRNFEVASTSLKDRLLDPTFKIVRHFFDRTLTQKCDLHVAVLNHDRALLQNLLSEQYFDVNMKDKGGRTALHLAVMNFIDVCDDSAMGNGSDDDDDDDDDHNSNDDNGDDDEANNDNGGDGEGNNDNGGDEAASVSVESHSIVQQMMAILLECGADLRIEDKVLCWRPLRLADRIRSWPAVELLLQKDANSTDLVLTRQNLADDNFVDGVLDVAAKHGYVQVISFMLNCGVSVSHRCREYNMLHMAAKRGHFELVKYLVEQNVDVDSQDGEYKRTALMWAVSEGHFNVVEYLLEHNAKINTRDIYGNTAIFLSTDINTFKCLVKNDGDVTGTIYKEGDNILHCVVESGDVVLTTFVLDVLKQNVNSCDGRNTTPLWSAAASGRLAIVQLLCDRGAQLDVSDSSQGKTPLHVAVENNHLEVVQFLLSRGASVISLDQLRNTPLLSAARNGNLDAFKLLLQYDTNTNACNEFGNNSLHSAVRSGSLEMVRYVLDELKMDVNYYNNVMETPVWIAAESGYFTLVDFLCERNADLSLVNRWGWSPLHVAVAVGTLETVKCLVKHGASLTLRDNDERTALDYARYRRNEDAVKYLASVAS